MLEKVLGKQKMKLILSGNYHNQFFIHIKLIETLAVSRQVALFYDAVD